MNVTNVIIELFKGFGMSVAIFFATLAISIPLGLVFAFLQRSKFKPISAVMDAFIWVISGTTLMLQIMVVFYVPGLLDWGVSIKSEFVSVLIAFSINYACYFSVIYKGGINSVAKGQYEACQVLGMTKSQTFFRVVFPQVYKNILPPMSNEIITLVKDTSLANIIGLSELIFVGKQMLNKGYLVPFFSTALFYLVFVGILTILFGYLEKRTQRYR